MERKEAIEVIKKNWPDSKFTMLREALETLIPELKESEDEKIRKELIAIYSVGAKVNAKTGDIPDRDIVAWLKKQGEQKPAWSEENECMLNDVIKFIETGWTDNGKSRLIPWLKSLRPHNICK